MIEVVKLEFAAVVGGQGFDSEFRDQGNQDPVHFFRSFILDFPNHGEPGFAVHKGYSTMSADLP